MSKRKRDPLNNSECITPKAEQKAINKTGDQIDTIEPNKTGQPHQLGKPSDLETDKELIKLNRDQTTVLKEIQKLDPHLIPLIEKYGPCTLLVPKVEKSPFESLVCSILAQQLSVKAADTIQTRCFALLNERTPEALLAVDPDQLRQAGVSVRKVSYLRGLAETFQVDQVDRHYFENMSDDQVVEFLCQIKGIGQWTAHMFLMFYLRRLNILPTGDLGVKKGMLKYFGKKSLNVILIDIGSANARVCQSVGRVSQYWCLVHVALEQ